MIGYYLDDTPYGVPNFQAAPPLKFFDIERVEVLRGPQGTLYGQGSMGGAIIFRTKSPDLNQFTFAGEADTSKTSEAGDANYKLSGAVSMPLIADKLGLRLSASYENQAGYNDIYTAAPVGTPYRTDANEIRNNDAQAVLLWQPNDELSFRVRAWHFEVNQDYLQVMNSLDPPYASDQGTFPGYDDRSAEYFSNTVTYNMDRFELTNATAYQETNPGGFGVGLGLGPPLGTGILINGGKAHSFVNEFRLRSAGDGPWHWVGGAFFQDATGFYNFSIAFPTLNLGGSTITKTRNASVFSEVSYDLMGGKLVPLIGLRYFEDKLSSESVSNGVPAASESNPDKWTWRANLAYYITDETMLFFNAGTGFRSGILQSQAQADAVVADGVPSDIALTPDELRNIEIGIKTTLADGRLGLAASIYDIRYTNLQSAFGTSIGLAAFANLGDAKSQGFDLDVTWATPVEGLTVSMIGNINKSEFTDVIPAFETANPRSGNGERLTNTPPYNYRLDANYEYPGDDSAWRFFGGASANRTGESKNANATVNEIDAWSTYRATLGIRKNADEFALYVDNISDFRGPTAANGPTLLAGPLPRTIGLRFRYQSDK
jgi:outer membrane receptor protein involved in Fe transport